MCCCSMSSVTTKRPEPKRPELTEIPRGPRPVPRLRPVEAAPEAASERLEPAGDETPAPAAAGKKPKREIPPYLRVIK